ncbi:hypothetical protein GOBAR_AA32604 [Gossypium barbadense]|uniref:Piwi domain-containing protein n=1 Tax=Gossypium barbadense TaxID=3634 RepID=A0A2P5WAH4_GOSBA|nr:hypothetical protein GOBAR_AA32604 [Gossypium barbadense]
MFMLGQTASRIPSIILGMNAAHGSPRESDMLLIAALDRSTASDYTQSLKLEMIDSLFKPVSDKGSLENVLHGTVIGNKVCHPKDNDFYLGTHAEMIGSTRQTHYQVLLDQAGFSANDLQ